jgi:hypothetical protein
VPNLPPGSANPVVPAVNATWVFTPTTGQTSSVSIWNNGTNIAYIGNAGVTQSHGFPLSPGNRPLRLQNITGSVYACGNVTVGAINGTVSGALTAGSTVIVTAVSMPTAQVAAGSVLIVGNQVNSGWEAVVVSTVSASSTTIGTTALAQDHVTASVIYAGTALPTSVVVQAGVL